MRTLAIALLVVACGGASNGAPSTGYSAEQATACQTAYLTATEFPPVDWYYHLESPPSASVSLDEERADMRQSLSKVATGLRSLSPSGADAAVSNLGQMASSLSVKLGQPMSQQDLDNVVADYTKAQNAVTEACTQVIQYAIDHGLVQTQAP